MKPLYVLRGAVEHGEHIGRTLGFPTVNLALNGKRPPQGVYAAKARTSSGDYLAVTNIGTRPTVSNATEMRAESYILDFCGDLYGQEIEIALYLFLRAEKKFESTDALKREIIKNEAQTREFFRKQRDA
ncbi:MAG: riboflavin kinase [Clostridia bacterium]|nr:riboflavin kinase [Clostridia bacterium]